jgi:hypothetical protein
MNTIQVQVKNVYGNELIYPICEKAHTFAALIGCKTLTWHAIQNIKKLGYSIETVKAERVI